MSIDVTVLRVFTDAQGNFGNPLGVVDAATVAPEHRQRLATQLGYSETVFIDLPSAGSTTAHARIYTPLTELPFAGHPTVGASWWLRCQRYADPHTAGAGRDCAGELRRRHHGHQRALGMGSGVRHSRSRNLWMNSQPPTPADFSDDVAHYLWTWIDESAGSLRSRLFAANLGVAEDEATGSAAVRMTEYLSRDLTITQGKGSVIETTWSPEGWVQVAGRVVNDGVTHFV